MPSFFPVSHCPELHYNSWSLDCPPPPDNMPSNRHNLILDEQAFQGLLSAAFIVQEYNDRLNRERRRNELLGSEPPKLTRPQAEPEARTAPESPSLCRHCGAPIPAAGSRCTSCGWDEFRPGERLQRNWASMWLMSQEQDLWPVQSPELRESAVKDVPPPAVERRPLPWSARDSAASDVVSQPAVGDVPSQLARSMSDSAAGGSAHDQATMSRSEIEDPRLDKQYGPVHGNPASIAPAGNQTEAESQTTAAAVDETIHEAVDEATDHFTQEGFSPEDSGLALHAFPLTTSDYSSPIEAGTEQPVELTSNSTGAGDSGNRSLRQRLADLHVTLRFHRSNLYLAGAVFVAALALLWPTAVVSRRAALSPWERALVTLGLAETPEPAVHLQGDPAIEVWVDPHTALYYCPGEEQYGKTADGRLSNQREAQMDRFEPAGHSVCE